VKTFEFPFRRGGFSHELIECDGAVCLVRRSKEGHWHFEVVELRMEPDRTLFDRFFPSHERYPGNDEWGTHGFTYREDQADSARERVAWFKKRRLKVRAR
jgi:hypothetical protein